jgi:hypothetical protein
MDWLFNDVIDPSGEKLQRSFKLADVGKRDDRSRRLAPYHPRQCIMARAFSDEKGLDRENLPAGGRCQPTPAFIRSLAHHGHALLAKRGCVTRQHRLATID